MTLFLVSDPDSPYYQSATFDKLLHYIQQNPRECQLRESGKKRSVVIRNIVNVETAVSVVEEIKKSSE
jgi:transcription-repair coupling factor (superfamily II helicase)